MTEWQYEEVLVGNTYRGFVIEGSRVVALVHHCVHVPEGLCLPSVADRDQYVVRSRKVLKGIVQRHNKVARLTEEIKRVGLVCCKQLYIPQMVELLSKLLKKFPGAR
ncbi:hypothetical protein LCGC14_0428810 [marine sediment metagenome]|uniref:Uncharacterized protein n=1 Tax=marine sediment metagenome TaxID=412755 RepID=A0A0F9VY06_9ZZZZ